MRNKSRDLFDFSSILEHKVFDIVELIELFNKVDTKINSQENIITFIKSKQEPKDDESVYLSETNRIDVSFEEIKDKVVKL
jgi:hypothetical protein